MTHQNPTTSLSKIERTRTPQQSRKLPSVIPSLPPAKEPKPNKRGLSLQAKTILIAIALSVIPVAIVGAISYKTAQSYVTQEINQIQDGRNRHMAMMLEKYIFSRVKEAETLATSPIFTNPNVISAVTVDQKKAALDSFQNKTEFYDSIVYLDLQGNPLFQSQSEHPLRKNYRQQKYFQTAITQKTTILNELDRSPYTGEPRIEFAVPVKNAWTDRVIGVMRFRIPNQNILPVLDDYANADEQWYVINTQGVFFLSTVENLNNQPLTNYFPQIQTAHLNQKIVTELVDKPENSAQEQIINYAPVKVEALNPDLNLGMAIALDTNIAFASLRSLKWIYLGGTISTALLAGSMAGFLANRIVQPLLKLTSAVSELSQGKLNTRIKLNRRDELALLGDQINDMAAQLEESMQRQKTIARTSELMARISQARTSRELQLPFSLFLTEVRNFLKADRVVFYHFDPQWRGIIVAESVAEGFPRTLGVRFDDPCFAQEYVRKYQLGRIQSVADIHQANLTACHLQQLEPYKVKASLVLPVILEPSATSKSEKLIGLLIAHQCSKARVWSQLDVDYLQQIAYQLAIVLKGYVTDQEDNLQKNSLQKDVAHITNQMKNVAQGNLGIGVMGKTNSSSEMTKSFNKILENLRQTIGEIQTPSRQINRELEQGKRDLTEIKDRLQQQTNQLSLILAFIEQITESSAQVSSQVGVASQTVDSVVKDIEAEKANFTQAIAFMSGLETNLRSNQNKVKNLSTASQKMTRVISSIRKINLRASLLASKLSNGIPELDESAYNLQEEIRSIQQSIAATQELETVMQGIDLEITEVLREYQQSENKLEQGNYFVTNASKNLEQILKVTKNAQQNLVSLVNTTKMQQHTAQKINNLQQKLNETSTSIAFLNNRTLKSLEETSVTAKDLENVVDFFQLEHNTTTVGLNKPS
jgi:methyl-accepting chemotaxis protein PixJ